MNQNQSNGYALITVVILLALSSLVSTLVFYHASETAQIATQITHNRYSQLAAATKAFNALDASLNSAGLRCDQVDAQFGKANSKASLCWLDSKFTVYDYNNYFLAATFPSGTSPHTGTKSRYGFSLTPGSTRSPKSIEFEKVKGLLPSLRILSNLEQAADLVLPANYPSTIAAAGYIDLPGNILVQNDALIIAGGDMHLGHLSANKALALQLVSASGVIAVDSITSDIKLSAQSPLAVYLPPNIPNTSPSVLKRKAAMVLGLAEPQLAQ